MAATRCLPHVMVGWAATRGEDQEVLVPKPCTAAPLWVHFGFKTNSKVEPGNVEEEIC
ncbi:Hypothetical predicted protein [Xyrichtys novacula]|uniref:Uncharacterized protein n=1 Tax=Xyrichtys novacula TaxID=13765 RepID=A0AAV1ET75_XYRNO|nr:Hypothetical predicted protein [Xyrichtys novacula]